MEHMPMAYECRHSADFDVSPECLFGVMTDVERRTVWVPMLIEVRVVGATPFGPGVCWDETYKTLGADDAVDNTVRLEAVTVDCPRRYVVRQLSAPGTQRPSSATWELPHDLATRRHGYHVPLSTSRIASIPSIDSSPARSPARLDRTPERLATR